MNFKIEEIVHEIIRQDVLNALNVECVLRTGSRIFGDATTESDYDLVVLSTSKSEKENFNTLDKMGFEFNGFDYDNDGDGSFWRHSIYTLEGLKGEFNVNIIFTTRPEVYWAWYACSQASLKLGLSKEQRKDLFNIIIDEGLCELSLYKRAAEEKESPSIPSPF